ncbi:MAG TPA: hypothetical protein VN285_13080 [Candidatus Deferrimicrobium sp.]|nr:hypothetical protein [Candidatus Deferrimicrobium sp.]
MRQSYYLIMTCADYWQTFCGEPFFNMAFDEWMAWRASQCPGAVLLRLYTWRTGAITIGLHQREELAVAGERLVGTPVIRRVTGGRAVYHEPSELTYAIAVNLHGLDNRILVGSTSATSAGIASALIHFLSSLGIESRSAHGLPRHVGSARSFHTLPCFASASRFEVVSGSDKVVASAQRRIGAAYLQHGAIKLSGIAPHPALRGASYRSLCAESVAPLTTEVFEQAANLFRSRVTEYLELTTEDRQLAGVDRETVCSRARFIQENPMSVRDFFQHWTSKNSLLQEPEREKTA